MIFDQEYIAKHNGEYYPATLVSIDPITFAVEVDNEEKYFKKEDVEVYVKINFN